MAQVLESLSFLGWKGRGSVAFFLGALSLLAMPPFFCWTILFVTMPVLVLLLDGVAMQQEYKLRWAAFIGWCFGFGYFLAGFYWVYHAFLIESNKFGWLIPIIVPLLPAILALFYALACLLAVWFWRAGAARIIALALSFAVVEWIRGRIFTGLPWHSFGYSLTASDDLMQSAAVFGIDALAFLAVVLFSSPVLLWHSHFPALEKIKFVDRKKLMKDFKPFLSCAEGRFFAGVMGLFLILFVWGNVRLLFDPGMNEDVVLRIVQPNIIQKDKWNPQKREEIVKKFMALTRDAAMLEKDQGKRTGLKKIVIWPESAMPFLLLRNKEFLDKMEGVLPAHTFLVLGNVRLAEENGQRRFYNSLLMFDHKMVWLDYFDKKHLIPFGEYMPLKPLFSFFGLSQLANAHGAFTVGKHGRFIAQEGIPAFAPLLCYEVVFPSGIIEKGPRPKWLLNLTNDAWYGLSDGPFQHLHYTRVRAVEQGLPMVRAANTGISAIINAYGQVVSYLPLGQSGVLKGKLPKEISPTLYARFGGWIFVLILVLGGLLYNNTKN